MKKIIEAAEKRCQPMFARIDEIALENTAKVLDALQRHEVAARHFAPTTGYGYDDIGRDTLEKLGAPDASSLQAVTAADALARRTAREILPRYE